METKGITNCSAVGAARSGKARPLWHLPPTPGDRPGDCCPAPPILSRGDAFYAASFDAAAPVFIRGSLPKNARYFSTVPISLRIFFIHAWV